MVYEIKIRKKALKYLSTLRKTDVRRIYAALETLSENPRPAGCKKLTGEEAYRIRIGSYRVIYEIMDRTLVVYVIKIGERGDVYK